MILMLKKNKNADILYYSVNLDDGIYELKDSGKIGVLSKEDDFKKYEDMRKEDFIKEVRKLRGYELPLITKYFIFMGFILYIIKKLNLRQNKKLFQMLPYVNLILATLILMVETMRLGREGDSIYSNIDFFFNSEGIMLFYVVYVPCIIIGTVAPLLSSNKDTENAFSKEQ